MFPQIPVCFKIFDIDQDGVLNYAEIDHLTDILLFVAKENSQSSEGFSKQAVLNDIVNFGKKNNADFSDNVETFQLKQEDFLMWTVENSLNLIQPFLDLTFEVCHIVFGLRPQCKHLENDIGEFLYFFLIMQQIISLFCSERLAPTRRKPWLSCGPILVFDFKGMVE